MARDIEEFLRRAAERRQQQKGGAKPPKAPRPQRPAPDPVVIDDVEILDEPAQARPRRPIESKIESKIDPKLNTKIKSKPNLSSIGTQSVADHVKSHIDTSDIAEHANNLGERIVGVHDAVEARIHGRLDNDISVIDDKPTVTDDQPAAIFGAKNADKAKALRRLLSDPTSVGQAIVIAEILKRPDFDD